MFREPSSTPLWSPSLKTTSLNNKKHLYLHLFSACLMQGRWNRKHLAENMMKH